MPPEPRPTMFGQPRDYHYAKANAYNGRWRLWYSTIADWMIEHPGGKLTDCAAQLGRNYGTVVRITQSDGFQDYFAKRRQAFVAEHDAVIKAKLTGVAESSLDIILAELKKKGDQTPLSIAVKIAESSLDRLGFAPTAQPQTVVNVGPQDNRTVVLQGVSAQALEEARSALRRAEEKKALVAPTPFPVAQVASGEGAEPEMEIDYDAAPSIDR